MNELMSGEAAKEHVTAVLSKSKLLAYFRWVVVSAYVCSLSKQRNRRHLTRKEGPHMSLFQGISLSLSLAHNCLAILPPLRLVCNFSPCYRRTRVFVSRHSDA